MREGAFLSVVDRSGPLWLHLGVRSNVRRAFRNHYLHRAHAQRGDSLVYVVSVEQAVVGNDESKLTVPFGNFGDAHSISGELQTELGEFVVEPRVECPSWLGCRLRA